MYMCGSSEFAEVFSGTCVRLVQETPAVFAQSPLRPHLHSSKALPDLSTAS